MRKPSLSFFILLTIVLAGILAISLILNAILYSRATRYYIELNQMYLDPLQLSKYPLESNPPKATHNPQMRVVFFGDSRAESWSDPSLPDYEFINRGIGGQTSVQIRQRFDQHLRPLQPDVVVIQVGINDLKTIGLFPQKKEEIIANCQENIAELVKRSKELGAVAILTTIFPFGEIPLARKPFWSDDIFNAVEAVNFYITTLAHERVVVLDTFPILSNDEGMMAREYRLDELHYNQQGYEKLNEELSKVLTSLKR